MPPIVMASSKGGCGKSTGAVVLGTELADMGSAVTLIDADPNAPISRWSKRPGKPSSLTVVGGVDENTLLDAIDAAERRTAFVVVDLEGTANLTVAYAISRADLVIIPLKGSALDALEAIKVIKFVRLQERSYRRSIPYVLLFTQTSASIRSRTLKGIEADLLAQGIPMLSTALHDRDAYRAIFGIGGTLATLDPKQVGNLPAARKNARAYAKDVIGRLSGLNLAGAA